MPGVLWVGLTGGIGSGKSTVARRLAEHGAVVIDADLLAREVVQPGTSGLAEVVGAFGDDVLDADGALDRAALAAKVFSDDEQRSRLNAIMHPLIGARTAELVNEAAEDAVVLHDVPLLVENDLAANYHLVIVVDADVESRVDRLVHARGIPEQDARARIAAQATGEQRREVVDVWLDNSGAPDELLPTVDALWADRLVAYESNLRLNRVADRGAARLAEPDPEWPRTARRLIARLRTAGGSGIRRVDHIGSTAIAGMPAKNIIDLQVAVDSIEAADELGPAISAAGFPPLSHITEDVPRAGAAGDWRKRLHASADPARPVHVHLRVLGSPGWRYALLMRDWLRADQEAAQEYRELKEKLAENYASDVDFERYTVDKEPWLDATVPRAEQWAQRIGWSPELTD